MALNVVIVLLATLVMASDVSVFILAVTRIHASQELFAETPRLAMSVAVVPQDTLETVPKLDASPFTLVVTHSHVSHE